MDTIRKALLLGIGTIALTKEKLEHFVDQAVARGEMSREEGKSFVQEALQKADEQKQWLSNKVKDETHKRLNEAGFSSKDEVETLRKQVEDLQVKIEMLTKKKENIQEEPSEMTGKDDSTISEF